jgi:hypothetical protein
MPIRNTLWWAVAWPSWAQAGLVVQAARPFDCYEGADSESWLPEALNGQQDGGRRRRPPVRNMNMIRL